MIFCEGRKSAMRAAYGETTMKEIQRRCYVCKYFQRFYVKKGERYCLTRFGWCREKKEALGAYDIICGKYAKGAELPRSILLTDRMLRREQDSDVTKE